MADRHSSVDLRADGKGEVWLSRTPGTEAAELIDLQVPGLLRARFPNERIGEVMSSGAEGRDAADRARGEYEL